jgi:hypothetical protein
MKYSFEKPCTEASIFRHLPVANRFFEDNNYKSTSIAPASEFKLVFNEAGLAGKRKIKRFNSTDLKCVKLFILFF